jgi:hypothetical protein
VGGFVTLNVRAHPVEPVNLAPWDHGAHRCFAFVDDLRVAQVEEYAEPEHVAAMRGDTAVAEVEAEQVHVRAGQFRETMRRVTTPLAPRLCRQGVFAGMRWNPTGQPVTDCRDRKARAAGNAPRA